MASIKGTWYAASNEHDGYPAPPGAVRFVYATQPDGERYIVAKVWSGDDGDYEGTARLVAAAPEMLAALKMLMELETTCDGLRPCYCNDPEVVSPCSLCVAFAAIAKAEGRE